MKKIVPVAACVGLAFLSTAAASEPATRALMPQGLGSLATNDDYPIEAIRNEEQGITAFRLEIGSNGIPTGCSITSSSGSRTLDATTCRIMMERARFQPARDANGRPAADSVTSRMRWVLSADSSARAGAITALWGSCVLGEAAKLVTSELTANEIVRRSFPPCAPLEALLSGEVKLPVPLEEARKEMVQRIEQGVEETRNVLSAEPEADATKGPL